MITKINFKYEEISHYDIEGKLVGMAYHYVAYPIEQADILWGYCLNTYYFHDRDYVCTKKMIENLITWGFESFQGIKTQRITFDKKYDAQEYNTLIQSDFICTVEYTD